MSEPSARATIPAARAVAAPPEEPPHVRAVSHGLRVAPKTGLKVCDPAPNSGVLVLPTVTAPAARSRATIRASWSGTQSANSGEPIVVRIPAVTKRSLCATGSPWSGPSSRPPARARSAATASASARSTLSVTTAFSGGLTASMRRRWSASTSRADTSPAASR